MPRPAARITQAALAEQAFVIDGQMRQNWLALFEEIRAKASTEKSRAAFDAALDGVLRDWRTVPPAILVWNERSRRNLIYLADWVRQEDLVCFDSLDERLDADAPDIE